MKIILQPIAFWLNVMLASSVYSHPEPVDGRISQGWNYYWKRLAQEREIAKGKTLISMLVISNGLPPFYVELVQMENGSIEVYTAAFDKEPLPGQLENEPVIRGITILSEKLAKKIHISWVNVLRETRYKNRDEPRLLDGTVCIIAAADFEFSKFLMGSFRLPADSDLNWMKDVALALRKGIEEGGFDEKLSSNIKKLLQ